MVIASCWNEARVPRICFGATSEMYAGAMTDAVPMPRPPTRRQITRSQVAKAKPEPIEEIRNSTAAQNMMRVRPQRSARRPAKKAPKAQPMSADATAKPLAPAERPNWSLIASTAPLITDESKPKRKPPTAAAMANAVTFPLNARSSPCWVVDVDTMLLCSAAVRGCCTVPRRSARSPSERRCVVRSGPDLTLR